MKKDNNSSKIMLSALLCVVTFCGLSAHGAIMTDPEQLLEDTSTNIAAGAFAAQSFTTLQNYITKVDVYLYADSSGRDVTFELRGGVADYPVPSSATTLLALKHATVSRSTAGYDWFSFDFSDDPIDVRNFNNSKGAGRLMFKITNNSTQTLPYRYKTSAATYPQGQWFVNGDVPYNGDMKFRVWSDGPTVTDPQQTQQSTATYLLPPQFAAQSFTPTRNYLYKINLWLYAGIAPLHTYYVTVEIRGGNADYPSPSQTTLLASKQFVVNRPTPEYCWYTFDFSDSPIDIRNYNSSVGAGRLMFKVKVDTLGDPGGKFWFYYQTGVSTYPQGEFFVNSDGRINGDMKFIAWTAMSDYTQITCGDPGTIYSPTDLNMDCRVDIKDFAIIAREWQTCVDPANSQCDIYWLNQ